MEHIAPAAAPVPAPASSEGVRLGSSLVKVTTLGVGALWIGPDVDAAADIVNRALELGIRYFDTAPSYSLGLSETGLGLALAGIPRDGYSLSTKVGRLLGRPNLRQRLGHAMVETVTGGAMGRRAFLRRARRVAAAGVRYRPAAKGTPRDPVWAETAPTHEATPVEAICDFSYDGVMRSIEESLARMGLARIDLALLHDPDFHHRQATRGAFRALDALRSDGTIGAIGVGMNHTEPLVQFAQEAPFDAFLVAGRYSLLDQTAADDLFDIATVNKISIILGGAFNGGLLADPGARVHFDYQLAGHEQIERARLVKTICDRHHVSVKAAALQFSAAHPAVTTLLLGPSSVVELDENVALLGEPIPSELWLDLERGGFIRPGGPRPS